MLEKGINYIDTARGYTVSEVFLGEALEGVRDKFILATKSMARTKDAMAVDIETSLKNLRTDYTAVPECQRKWHLRFSCAVLPDCLWRDCCRWSASSCSWPSYAGHTK